jgi:hypothetical protein
MDVDLSLAIPTRGYLRDYVALATQTRMSPPEFHLACGLAQMATIMGNRVLIRGLMRNPIPPHSWFVLLAGAGQRKTTSVALAKDLLRKAIGSDAILPEEFTPEALWQRLSQRSAGLLTIAEFAGFLQHAGVEYMSSIKEDLCKFFDSAPEEKRELRKETFIVRQPSVSIIGATVPERLGDLVRGADVYGGFFSRFLFVHQVTPVPYIGLMSEETDRAWDIMEAKLRKLAMHEALHGPRPIEVRFSPEAREMWESYDEDAYVKGQRAELASFFARAGTYVLKLAYCYAFAVGSLVPEPADVRHAIAFVDFCRKRTLTLLEAELADTKDARDFRRVRRVLASIGDESGWVARSELLRKSRMKSRQLDELLADMEQTEEIERRETGHVRLRRDERDG